MKCSAFLLSLFLVSLSAFAQEGLSAFHGNLEYPLDEGEITETDSVKPHSIRTALLLSAGIPGAGQIYNHIAMPKGKKKAYWKVPLIYAGLGASTYFLVSNQAQVSSLRNEYRFMESNDGAHSDNSKWVDYDQSGVLLLHDQYQTFRDLSILAVGLVYLLQLTDAGVEAHFVNFDISHDLSFHLDPVLFNSRSPGLSLSLKFR
ncbi:MAG: hypothetical protein A3D92_09760 [Bacteroidetes bacterium RIFCSPHIGHO2_02_FULL_44_7]|nr:MAG: hypothetical protein A3D92_09760 [Bacteroidetes bacterium RIFCSPHIGHO2_02_FULL_44_7]